MSMVTDICITYLDLEEIIVEDSDCFLLTIELFSGGVSIHCMTLDTRLFKTLEGLELLCTANSPQSRLKVWGCDDFLQRTYRINQRGSCLRNLCPKHNLCVQSINMLLNLRFISEFKVQSFNSQKPFFLESWEPKITFWSDSPSLNVPHNAEHPEMVFWGVCDMTPHTMPSGPMSGPRLQWSCIVKHDHSLP